MNINLAKTVNDKDFNQVFTEVFHSEGLGVHANSELRLFRLKDVTDFHFSQDNLLTFFGEEYRSVCVFPLQTGEVPSGWRRPSGGY